MTRFSGKQFVGWLTVVILGILCTGAHGQEAAAPAKRAAVPAVAAQNDARKLLGDLFRADFEQAKKPEEKAALAERMLQVGNETLDDPTGQYMLFQIAKEIAIGAPSADVALRALDAQGASFEIDVPEAKLAVVTAIEKNLKFSKDRQSLLESLHQLVDEYLQAEHYDLAKKGVTLSIDLARKIPDANAIKQGGIKLKEIDTREKLFGDVQAARKILETKPDDPAANLTVGRFLCLVNGDWEQGLPLLAKCGDAKLKQVAELELAQPQETDKQVELADGWWDLSEKEQGAPQSALQQRAVAWYQTALPQLTGLAKLKVTGRIEKAGGKPGEGASVAVGGPGKTLGKPTQKLVTNSLGMKLVLIPAGTFTMGSPEGVFARRGDETQHRVTLTKPYYLGMTEVTQQQWIAVMGTRPWQGKQYIQEGNNIPASYISWDGAVEFCRKLSEKEKKTYRLPTEAEWEYACRAGTTTEYCFGEDLTQLNDYAWWGAISRRGNTNDEQYAHSVGGRRPNPAGLYDMHGNVWEWCSDWHANYASSEVTDPIGPGFGTNRVMRGGAWDSDANVVRSARRAPFATTYTDRHTGFRVVLDPQEVASPITAKPTNPTTPVVGGPKGPPLKAPPASLPRIATNSVGIPLVLIPGGKFTMGSPEGEEGRKPDEKQHAVTISKYFYIGATEVTQGQWKTVMGTEPWEGKSDAKSDDMNAASYISWGDATEFCRKLGEKEKKTYRLPTEAEWEYACRAGTTTAWSYGPSADNDHKDQMWNYFNCVRFGKNHEYAHAVGKKPPNPAGLFDMHGNVKEWCQDWLGPYPDGDAVDPQGAESGTIHIARGGSGTNQPPGCRSATRDGYKESAANWVTGFRVVYDIQTPANPVKASVATPTKPTTPSSPAPGGTKPTTLTAPGTNKQQVVTNSIGMKLVLLPAGKFMMGSPPDEPIVREGELQHRVTLTKPFYMGMTEVTQGQWTAVMGTKPWEGKGNIQEGSNYAASYMSWEDAVEFCRKLGEKESKAYRLPTEAEWEYACRAGTQTATNFSEPIKGGECAWSISNAGHGGQAYPHEVAQKLPNAAGLYDMLGNVRELCSDWYGPYSADDATDPQGAATGTKRVTRGGSWGTGGECFRSAHRYAIPTGGSPHQGFRVVYDPQPAVPAVKPASTTPTQPTTSSSRPVPTGRGTPIARTGSSGPDKWKEFKIDQGEMVDGKVRLANKGSLSTTAKVSGPVAITVVAKTNSTNIRVQAVGRSMVIWNWEVRRDELRVHWPDNSISKAKVAALETDRWYRLRWVIEKDRISVYTDDELVFQEAKPGLTFDANPVRIIPGGSTIEIDSVVVVPLDP